MTTIKAISALVLLLVRLVEEALVLVGEARAYLVKRTAMLEYKKADDKAEQTHDTTDLEDIFAGKPPAHK